MVERVTTGIKGLDKLIEGGFFKNSVNLITGKTGTGKTAFCASFLYEGAIKGEPGVYVTTEEREEDIKEDIKAMFNWDLEKLEKKGLLVFLSLKPIFPRRITPSTEDTSIIKMYVFDLCEKLEKMVKKMRAKRLVIDSISIIEMFIKDDYIRRIAITELTNKLKEIGVTSIITGTIPEGSEKLTIGGIAEFLVDSVIKLEFVPVAEEFKRTLTIRKMRRTDHSIFIHPFEIKKSGIRIIEIK